MIRAVLLGASALTLGACTMAGRYEPPQPAFPRTPVVAVAPTPALSYRQAFGDERLVRLVDRALAANQDLRAAVANVEISRAQARIRRAAILPAIGVQGTASQNDGQLINTGVQNIRRGTLRNFDLEAGVASFELDLFGRLRSLSQGAQERYLASEAGARAARLTLVGEVAAAWLTLAGDRSLLAIALENQANAKRSVELTTARFGEGIASKVDMAQAATLFEQARSERARLQASVAADRNALELLVGGAVDEADTAPSIESLDGVVAQTPAGLDSRLLLARPDVIAAEHDLKAAHAEIGAARAAFFPTISLTALSGYASPALSSLVRDDASMWRTQGGVSLPLFNGGANVAGLAQAKGAEALALANYQRSLQGAFRDVADALARRESIAERRLAEAGLEAAAEQGYRLADLRYRNGLDPYLIALDAQRTLYSARSRHASMRLADAVNQVGLYVALGGDGFSGPVR